MSFGLKIWLILWGIFTIFLMFRSLDTNTYKIFSFVQMHNNLFIFSPATSILCGSIWFQVLQNIFKCMLIPACIATISYFIILIFSLPYSICASILLGFMVAPAGILHYIFSVKFFGEIEMK